MTPERLAEIGHFLDNSHGLQRQHRELAHELYGACCELLPPSPASEDEPGPEDTEPPAPADSVDAAVTVEMKDAKPFEREPPMPFKRLPVSEQVGIIGRQTMDDALRDMGVDPEGAA